MGIPLSDAIGFSVDDESTWRVTSENPVREVIGLDWERCAVLHNLIVRTGWTGAGNEESAMPKKSWWQHYITSEALDERWTRRLSSTLKQFLQAAYQTPKNNLFYYVSCIECPEGLFQRVFDQDGDILCLYQMTNIKFSGHRVGLNYNQETCRAIFCDDIQDQFVQMNDRVEWDPLEVVLSAWLNMIDTGKVVVMPTSKIMQGPWECEPWELPTYSEAHLRHTVSSFDNLVARIECLLAHPELKPLGNAEDQAELQAFCEAQFNVPATEDQLGLISPEVLDRAGITGGFMRKFLLQVRRPKSIRYIAPGLRLPTAKDFDPHPFQRFIGIEEHEDVIFPVPIFPADIISPRSLFGYPYQELSNIPYGLWMEECNGKGEHAFENACRLYLPFEIGANGFARLTDGLLMGENPISPPSIPPKGNGRKNDLYQTGYCHFIPWHAVQLGEILEQWANMVGLGEWEVGAHGVLADIEKFKEADTEENFHKYQVFHEW